MIAYEKATWEILNRIWDKSIEENPEDHRYIRWKQQFLSDNETGAAATFVILADGDPVGEGTLLLSPDCRAIRGRRELCDGEKTANINALRVQKEYEGQGHISALMKTMERYARSIGIEKLTIGVEAAETRNLAIYLHWGFRNFLMHEIEDGELILYFGKNLKER